MIIPEKLKEGDEIRVIAPAKSFKPSFTEERRLLAISNLEKMGLKIGYGKYVNEINEFESTTIEHRIEDLHDAFLDQNVKGILTVLGGTTSNQLLKYIDYDLIKKNPKILCGLSDITSLANAINAKTGLVTYSGPHFTVFGIEEGIEYTQDYFQKCMFEKNEIQVKPSETYYKKRMDTEKFVNEGIWVINEGKCNGKIVGGNLITLNLLQGSEYMPELTDSVLFLEDNEKESIRAVENHLQSLILQPNFRGVKGIVFGRFQIGTGMTRDLLTKIVRAKKELKNLPIVANMDFGHTLPMFTFPIGGEVEINTENDAEVKITMH